MQQYEINYISMHSPPLQHIMEREVVMMPHEQAAHDYGQSHAVSMNETKKYEFIEIALITVKVWRHGKFEVVGTWHVRQQHEIKGLGLEEIRKQADEALNAMRLKPDDQQNLPA